MTRIRIARRLAVVAAAVTTTTVIAWPAHAASWTPAATVSAPEGVAGQQQVAIDGSGTATVVWAERRTNDVDVIKAARRSPGGSWSSAVTLSNSERHAAEPQVVASDNGAVVAAWVEDAAASPTDSRRIMAATLGAGGSWNAAKAVSAAGGVSRPRLAGNAGGDAIVMWHQRNGLRTSRLNAGDTTWATPQAVSASGRQHDIAMATTGVAYATWKDADGEGIDRVKAARATPNGSWESAATLSRSDRHGEEPAVAVDDNGNAQVLWVLRSSRRVVQAAQRTGTGSWTAAQSLSDLARNAVKPEVALDAEGNAVAVWQINLDSTASAVAAATRTTGGTWSAPQELTAAGASPQVGIDDERNAHVVWLVNARSDSADDRVEAMVRPPAGVWSGPDTVAAESHMWSVALAVNGDGQAAAAWRQTESDFSRVRASATE